MKETKNVEVEETMEVVEEETVKESKFKKGLAKVGGAVKKYGVPVAKGILVLGAGVMIGKASLGKKHSDEDYEVSDYDAEYHADVDSDDEIKTEEI